MQWSGLSRFRFRILCACLCLLLSPLTVLAAPNNKQESDDKGQAFSLLASAAGIEIGDDAAAAYGCERITTLKASGAASPRIEKSGKSSASPSTTHAAGADSSPDASLRRAVQIQDVETRNRAELEIAVRVSGKSLRRHRSG